MLSECLCVLLGVVVKVFSIHKLHIEINNVTPKQLHIPTQVNAHWHPSTLSFEDESKQVEHEMLHMRKASLVNEGEQKLGS